MDVRVGYKQTEVGVIPNDWKLITYDEAFNFLSSASYSRAELSESGYANYIHYGDIHTKWNHFIDLSNPNIPYIQKEQIGTYSIIKEGDLIIADASEDYDGIGKSVEVNSVHNTVAVSGLHTFLLRDKFSHFSDGFKGYIHSNKMVKRQFDKLATGLKVFGLTRTNLKKVLIPIPPTKTEQTAIATALNDVDALITQLEKLITKKRQIKQGAMQILLNPFDNNGKLKDGWHKFNLGSIAEFNKGKGLPKSELSYSGKYECIHYGELFTKYKERIHNIISRTDANYNTSLSKANDILMPTSDVTPNGLATASCVTQNNVILGGDILIIRPKASVLDGIFFSYLVSIEREQVMQLVSGSTVYHLYGSDMSKFNFFAPSDINQQKHISKTLSCMDTEISALQSKLTKTQKIKQGMMQALLTGQIRLVDAKH